MKSAFYLAIFFATCSGFPVRAQDPGIHKKSRSSDTVKVQRRKSSGPSTPAAPKTDSSARELAKVERTGIKPSHTHSSASRPSTNPTRGSSFDKAHESRSKPVKFSPHTRHTGSKPAQTNSRASGHRLGKPAH